MARTDRCPICQTPVKPENLIRHLNATHPRNPDTPQIVSELKAEPGRVAAKRAARPIRVNKAYIAVIAVVVLGGVAAAYLAPYFSPSNSEPFPCVTATLVYHWHADLIVHSGPDPVVVPADIGLTATCAEPLHTHDASGQIHIETDVNRLYSIGDFFRVWGKSFDSPNQMVVNGTAVTPSASVILYDQETVHLYYASFA